MKSPGYILWGSAITSLILAAFKPSLIWVAAPLLALALSYSLFCTFVYRPPENHIGAIYLFDRLWRLVGPDDLIVVIPGVHEIKPPISLHLHRVDITLSDVLTQDRVPVHCDLVVYYQLDLRYASTDFRSQALRIPDEGWDSIIRTVLSEKVNDVIGGVNLQQLLSPEGRGRLKRMLSALLAEQVQSLGILVNPRTGVSVQRLRPGYAVWHAMMEELAAVALGEAAAARVRPILEELSRADPKLAWETLLLGWAAAVVQQGNLPQLVIAPGDGLGRDGRTPGTLPGALQAVLQDIVASAAEHRVETTTVSRSQDNEQRAT